MDIGWAGERDPQRFWLVAVGALRQTAPGSALVQPLTAAPDLDGWAIVERLLTDLAPLAEPAWLVIDDVHELDPDALRQLELLIMRAPEGLRFVLATRHDVRLGLHRLRLEGELAEIREPDLRFSLAEARELFDAAGVELAEPTLELLVERPRPRPGTVPSGWSSSTPRTRGRNAPAGTSSPPGRRSAPGAVTTSSQAPASFSCAALSPASIWTTAP